MNRLLFLLVMLLTASSWSQTNDSITLPTKYRNFHELYKKEFSIFDTIIKRNDTIYMLPLTVEPKIILHDSFVKNTPADGVQQVVLSTIEVTRRYKNNDLSYFSIAPPQPFVYDKTPRSNYRIPYDERSPIYSEISYWTKLNALGLDINQGTFTNWSAGGYSSVSGIAKADFTRKYERGRTVWLNELKIRYGLNKQENVELRKTDDVLNLNSAFGYKSSVKSHWYYSAKITLNTQLSNGYAYPDVENPISTSFAPAYVFVGIGSEYFKKDFKAYISPATLKSTLVLDETLANRGEFGLEGGIFDEEGNLLIPGKKSRNELGFLFTSEWKKTLMKNVVLKNNVTLYTDYLNNFGNIDVDWQLQFEMSVNDAIKATLGGHLIYDDDIKNKRDVDGVQITEGPKVQFKQLLSIGLVYKF